MCSPDYVEDFTQEGHDVQPPRPGQDVLEVTIQPPSRDYVPQVQPVEPFQNFDVPQIPVETFPSFIAPQIPVQLSPDRYGPQVGWGGAFAVDPREPSVVPPPSNCKSLFCFAPSKKSSTHLLLIVPFCCWEDNENGLAQGAFEEVSCKFNHSSTVPLTSSNCRSCLGNISAEQVL